MPLIFGGALVSLLVLVAGFGLLILHRTASINLRAQYAAFAEKGGFRRWFFHAIGLTALVGAIDHVVHRFRQAIVTSLAPSLPMLTHWLQAVGSAAHWTYKEYGDWTTHWADNFAWFRHRTLPRVISKKTVPIAAAAAAAGAIAERVNHRERAHAKRFEHGIDRLRKEQGLLAGILLGIDILVRGRHAHRHHHTHERTIPAHTAELRNHATRLKRIEKALGLGVIAGVVFKVLARVAPWLFCRNVKQLGKVACGLNPSTMSALEALLLGTLAIESLEDLARFTIAIEEDVANEVKTLLNA